MAPGLLFTVPLLMMLACITVSYARPDPVAAVKPSPVRHRVLLAASHKTQLTKTCQDQYPDCVTWAQQGICDPGWTIGAVVCPSSCNNCASDGSIGVDGGALNPNDWLGIHNYYRSMHGAPALESDDFLIFTAQQYANELASECTFQESGLASVGENIAAGFFDWASTIKGWYDEIAQYDFKNPAFSETTGHFSQLLWKSTTSVGCGVVSNTKCQYNYYYVCQYTPAGNVPGEFVDNL